MGTYKIVRCYYSEKVPNRVIKTGLTLAEAQEYCRDPETSSKTCTKPENVRHTEQYGPWFDGYDMEK